MRILCVGDIHEPCSHPGYLDFCRDLRDKYHCDTVMFIGDIVDFHAISFHAHQPEAPGPLDEYELAHEKVQRWYRAFPKARVCVGNHDERVIRLAESVNIPSKFLRDYREVWGTPGWTWDYEHILDGTYFFHGTGNGGMHPAFNAMKKMLMSVVMGHIHTASGIKWAANPERRIFGMDTGCGIDDKAYAFAYGRHMRQRSILSAGVVLDGIPFHEVMACGAGEKYNRHRYENKKEKHNESVQKSKVSHAPTRTGRRSRRPVRARA